MKSVPSMQKFKSRKEWENYVWEKLKVGRSLDMLLTAHEKKQMINRAAAISFLRQGKSYRDIGEVLWLSSSTISAIRKSVQAQKGYISRYTRNKKPEKKQKPLTKEEWDQLQFSLWLGALFTLPPPPIPHTRLMRQLGYKSFRKRK